jgi:hypothetical protein
VALDSTQPGVVVVNPDAIKDRGSRDVMEQLLMEQRRIARLLYAILDAVKPDHGVDFNDDVDFDDRVRLE